MCREDAKTALRSFRVYVVQILERGIESQLHAYTSVTSQFCTCIMQKSVLLHAPARDDIFLYYIVHSSIHEASHIDTLCT